MKKTLLSLACAGLTFLSGWFTGDALGTPDRIDVENHITTIAHNFKPVHYNGSQEGVDGNDDSYGGFPAYLEGWNPKITTD
ncbi:MAG: hypothetical protein ACP5D2_04945, partial [Candidatus Nanoarchaeia archaeon]